MRILDHPDGSIERAREILPNGVTRVVPLPNRVGGGLVVYIASSTGTQMWRAKSWLGNLEPVAELWGTIEEMSAGFDRLYVRMTSGEVRAIDPDSGRQLSLGPLPPATRFRSLAFADAWRAVAIVDFRGALATFDAGNTWRPIPLEGLNVNQVAVRDGDFVLDTPRGRYLLGPGGELSRDESRESQRAVALPVEGPPAPASERSLGFSAWDSRGLGRRPLRAAIEDGWPVAGEGEPAAVLAQGGALYRVGLETGVVLDGRRGVFRDDDVRCHAFPLRDGLGFVCGALAGGSTVYALEPSLEMREVARFVYPRVIVPSGNGGFVVRGSCARDAPTTSGGSPAYCFFTPFGDEKEWRPPGATADENAELRPVVLRDGRALFVLPPSLGSSGKLFVSRGPGFDVVPLALDDRKASLRRAYLLEGVEEREPGVLGAWTLVGNDLRGVRIGIDGAVTLASSSTKVEQTVVAGRFGLEWAGSGRGRETVDGGMIWSEIEVPAADASRGQSPVAACGPVGCVKDQWMRVGWGRVADMSVDAAKSPAGDLPAARAPERSRVALAPARGVSLQCRPTGEIAGPAAVPPKPAHQLAQKKPAPPGAAPIVVRGLPRVPLAPSLTQVAKPSTVTPSGPGTTWSPFRGHAPPAFMSGDVAVEAGTDPPMTMQARIYTWGPRGAEWVHSGHVQARFDDRFELLGIRSTAVTAPPWSDEDRASDALGLTSGQPVNWTALLEPSGGAAVLVGQRGAGRADLYAAASGEPLVFWRDAEGGSLPVPTSVVRIGSTWFFLHSLWTQNAWATNVYRVDGGVVRRLARLPRIPVPAGEFAPKLMRRTQSKGLGILVLGAPGFDQTIRDWYVLPIDADTGDLDEPARLFGSDLEGQILERCPEERDGWAVNTELSLSPAARITSPASASLSAIELRLRLDPGKVCVDAMAARAEGLGALPSAGGEPDRPLTRPSAGSPIGAHHASEPRDIPLAATDPASGRRWLLACHE